jgi:lambda repressor-like predicted transcriptional regulator
VSEELERVSDAAKRLDEAARKEDKARRDLYAAIKRAHRKSASLREIARAAGLSHARVAQILHDGR